MTNLLWQEDRVTSAEELKSMMTEPSEAVVKKRFPLLIRMRPIIWRCRRSFSGDLECVWGRRCFTTRR